MTSSLTWAVDPLTLAQRMRSVGIESLLLCNASGNILACITDRDLARRDVHTTGTEPADKAGGASAGAR